MKFIHLSDLHFNPAMDGRTTRNLRKELITYLKELQLSVNELIITGDFRHAQFQMNEQKYVDEVVKYIWAIANAVHIKSVKNIHIIPGNHDRDRPKNSKRRIVRIKNNYNINNGTFKQDDLEYLKKHFVYFNMVCNTLYGHNCFWKQAELHTYRFQNGTVFLYLNTSIMHNEDADRNHLIIGNDYLDQLLCEIDEKYSEYPIIVLAHHSPDYFEKHEKEAVEDIFRRHPKISLYLCGDAHESWPRKINGHIEITMGCLKHETEVENTFLYGNTDCNEYIAHHWVNSWEPYSYFNKMLKDFFPKTPIELSSDIIQDEQALLRNDTLLPWMRRSPSIEALFPQIFVEPIYCSEKLRHKYTTFYDIIKENGNSNVIFTGEAGTGKTTLLRQIFLFKNSAYHFLYLHAKSLEASINDLSPYQKFVRNLLLNGKGDDRGYLVFLDGIDEVYTDNPEGLNRLIYNIDQLKNTHVWFGWRREHLMLNETEKIRLMTRDTISLSSWTDTMISKFVKTYAEVVKQPNIIKDFDLIVSNNDIIKSFTASPFHLSLLIYLIENKATNPAISEFFVKREQTIYNLYEVFFQCWIKKEHERKTSQLSTNQIRTILWEISSKLYYGYNYEIQFNDTAIVDLLSFSEFGDRHIANSFFHRSFCAFFLADKVYNSVKKGDIHLIDSLKIPLRNDVTDFVRSAISGSNNMEIIKIQKNLINAYQQIDDCKASILSKRARNKIINMEDKDRFILKNELIYLMTRIPDPTGNIPSFLEKINLKNNDPYIRLDIAYAATLTGPKYIALDYAKTLVPGSESDIINRSWTLAYFGDVQANPHEYRDTEKASWQKSREARLKRFQKSDYKALRFRILDFPLLYCYYVDRNWQDINDADYQIIENADIDNEAFSTEEKEFLKFKKGQLLRGFREHML